MEQATLTNRIASVPYEPTLEVFTSWDLGISDSTAIWFAQVADREIRLIDYYENSGAGLDHYVKILKEKDYVYADHFLPHDIQVKEMSTGRSRLEMLRGLGVRGRVVPKLPLDDGINAVRAILPRCWFDRIKCERGIEALRQYRTQYNEKTQTFMQRPRHDWTSHASDSFRYLATSIKDGNSNNKSRPTVAINEYDVFSHHGRETRASDIDRYWPW